MSREQRLKKYLNSANLPEKVAQIILDINATKKVLELSTVAKAICAMRELSDKEIQLLEQATRPIGETEFPSSNASLEDRLKDAEVSQKKESQKLAKLEVLRFALCYTMEKKGIKRLEKTKEDVLAAQKEIRLPKLRRLEVYVVTPDKSTAGRTKHFYSQSYPALAIKKKSRKTTEKDGRKIYVTQELVLPIEIIGFTVAERAGMPPYLSSLQYYLLGEPETIRAISEKSVIMSSKEWHSLLRESQEKAVADSRLAVREFFYKALKEKKVLLEDVLEKPTRDLAHFYGEEKELEEYLDKILNFRNSPKKKRRKK